MRGIVVLAGSSHPELAQSIMSRLGLPLGGLKLAKFANGEISVEIGQSVRDQDVYIVQTSHGEVNDYLMEALILVHACKIASAARVTLVVPCFPYSRHVPCPVEKPHMEPLTAHQESLLSLFRASPDHSVKGYRTWAGRSGRLVASMIEISGADHVITVDLHDPQFQGFFSVPMDNLPASPLIIRFLKEHLPEFRTATIVSPDAGGAKRATEFANLIGVDFALIHRNQQPRWECSVAPSPHPSAEVGQEEEGDVSSATLVGNVQDRDAIIIDDMADTCATLTEAAAVLKRQGARNIYAVITHGIFSDNSLPLIEASEITAVIVSNTIPQAAHLAVCQKFRVVDISPILAEAIRRAHNGESISYLFSPQAF